MSAHGSGTMHETRPWLRDDAQNASRHWETIYLLSPPSSTHPQAARERFGLGEDAIIPSGKNDPRPCLHGGDHAAAGGEAGVGNRSRRLYKRRMIC